MPRIFLLVVGVLALVAVLGGNASGVRADSPSRTATARSCPNPEGGKCLGKLKAGTYDTVVFQPKITYTVPAGWSNFEDIEGNFLLVPPWGTLHGVGPGTSDYIGIYASIAAASPGCKEFASPTVGHTPNAISRWITRNRGLDATRPARVSIGGLHGFVLDMQMRKSWKKTCPYSRGAPVVQLITGRFPSTLDHTINPRPFKMRLYLLSHKGETLAIEVVDLRGGRHLKVYSALIKQIRFGT